jgi:hypothetical protein
MTLPPNEFRSRFTIANGVVFAIIGVLALLLAEPLRYSFGLRGTFVYIFGVTSTLTGIGFLLLAYLRGDLGRSDKLSRDFYDVLVSNRTIASYPDDIRFLRNELAHLTEVVGSMRNARQQVSELGPDEINSLRAELKTQLEGVLANDLVAKIEEKYSSTIADAAQVAQIRKGFEITSLRLRQEINALSRRSNVNLVIGVLTTVVAVAMLGYLVWGSRVAYTNLPDLLSHFIPRISVAVFIEVFSFFFLKLYKSNLEEIKYFQNELTNIEMKVIAHEAALFSHENKSIPSIIEQLVRTDRNIQPTRSISENGAMQFEPKDIGDLLDKIGKLLSIGAHK